MAGAYMGRWGKVYAGSTGAVTYIDNWTLNVSVGTADITAYADTARAYAQTIRDGNFSFGGTLDRSDTEQADILDQFEDGVLAPLTIRLYSGNAAASTEFWAGQGLFTGMTVNSAVGDKVGVTFNGVFTGGVSYWTSGATG